MPTRPGGRVFGKFLLLNYELKFNDSKHDLQLGGNIGAKCGHKFLWLSPRRRQISQTMADSGAGRFWVPVPPNKCRHIQYSRPCSAQKCQCADCRSKNSYKAKLQIKILFIFDTFDKWTVRRRRGWMLISMFKTQRQQIYFDFTLLRLGTLFRCLRKN